MYMGFLSTNITPQGFIQYSTDMDISIVYFHLMELTMITGKEFLHI